MTHPKQLQLSELSQGNCDLYVTDRFGNIPYACFRHDDQIVAMTREDYVYALTVANICNCGKCVCCEARRYVKEVTGHE